MKTFKSMSDFADHLIGLAAEAKVVVNHLADEAAAKVEKIAKAEIGHYQPAVGPFRKWEDLADSTEFDKINKGFPVDAPLLRTGELRASIERTVSGNEAAIGSNDKRMEYHELGTVRIPPRAVLGPAAIRANKDMQPRFALTIAAWLGGRAWRRPRLK